MGEAQRSEKSHVHPIQGGYSDTTGDPELCPRVSCFPTAPGHWPHSGAFAKIQTPLIPFLGSWAPLKARPGQENAYLNFSSLGEEGSTAPPQGSRLQTEKWVQKGDESQPQPTEQARHVNTPGVHAGDRCPRDARAGLSTHVKVQGQGWAALP